MRHTSFISLGVLVLGSLASHVPAQVKQGPTTKPVAEDKGKKATDRPSVTFHVIGMKKTKSGAT
ncbi:MAG: hypothetical protein ACE5F1_06780 [Planctomycetota bacterium]